jgi:hypothetical protein
VPHRQTRLLRTLPVWATVPLAWAVIGAVAAGIATGAIGMADAQMMLTAAPDRGDVRLISRGPIGLSDGRIGASSLLAEQCDPRLLHRAGPPARAAQACRS